MRIIDPHVHVWANDPAFPWAPETTNPPAHDATPEMLLALMTENGIDRTVLVQPIQYRWDNRYVADALERYHVDAELRSHPDSTLILSVANLRDSVPSHDGGIFLRWRVPVKVLAQGRYAASFRLLAPDDPGEVIEEILVRLEVVGSGSE